MLLSYVTVTHTQFNAHHQSHHHKKKRSTKYTYNYSRRNRCFEMKFNPKVFVVQNLNNIESKH